MARFGPESLPGRQWATTRVEFHHIEPHARGGAPTVENLALRCAAHNRYEAQRDFGTEHMERVVAEARTRRRESRPSAQGSLF